MSCPGSFPGDPAEQQPGPPPSPGAGAFEYPSLGNAVPSPPPFSGPPPGHSPTQPIPPGYVPPPPPYQPYDGAYRQHPPQYSPQYLPPYPPQHGAPYGAAAPANGLAIGSLVSALVGIPAYLFCCFGFIGSILGVILGIVAVNQIGKSGQRGKEMAFAGIALGALGLVGMGWFLVLDASPSIWY